ncbi:MAG: hypothetical protein LBH42_05120, partial [Treponema sp.]|nr:hypothetical protein [Treponema sp.]
MSKEQINKYKIKNPFLVVMILGLIILSCEQNSIFNDISLEPEPKDPLIPGSPTNIVVARNQVFAGSRMGNKIYRYTGSGGQNGWSTISVPGGSLGELASDGYDLYVLVFSGGDPLKSSVIKRYSLSLESWDTEFYISQYSIQTLYGANGRIFAGGQLKSNYQNYAIFYLDPSSSSLIVIKYSTSLLKGVASDGSGSIYLATAGNGIFLFVGDSVEPFPTTGTTGAVITGIIGTGGSVVAVSSNGNVYSLNTTGNFSSYPAGVIFTGALSLWSGRDNQWRPSMLLMGIRGRGRTVNHGYREMILDRSGRPTPQIRIPGEDPPTSVVSRAKYAASIG